MEDISMLRFIVFTQGPKPKTIADFWTMVSQEEVTVIVCLTNLKEGTKVEIWSFCLCILHTQTVIIYRTHVNSRMNDLEINISYSVEWYIDILVYFYQLISEQVCTVLAKLERQATRRKHHDQELGRKNIR